MLVRFDCVAYSSHTSPKICMFDPNVARISEACLVPCWAATEDTSPEHINIKLTPSVLDLELKETMIEKVERNQR